MQAANFQNFRLSDWSWVDEYYNSLGSEEFWAYLNNVWDSIEKLLPKQFYSISSIPEDRQDLFIKFCCLYIIDHNGCDNCGVQFSNDYSKIMKFKQIQR